MFQKTKFRNVYKISFWDQCIKKWSYSNINNNIDNQTNTYLIKILLIIINNNKIQ